MKLLAFLYPPPPAHDMPPVSCPAVPAQPRPGLVFPAVILVSSQLPLPACHCWCLQLLWLLSGAYYLLVRRLLENQS